MRAAQGVKRNDITIREDVLAELDWDARVRPGQLGVTVKDGIVTLTGVVESLTQRWAAQRAAFRVVGVTAVANEIEVRLPQEAQRTDTDLAQAAVNTLTWDTDVPTEALQVSVTHSWVTLDGVVDTLFQRQQAARAVHHLVGALGVTNLLTVREPQPAPADVRQRIERALVRNAETDARNIQLEVHGHTVTLRGTVHSYAELTAAEGSALSAPGITEVENRLDVMPVD